MHERGPASPSSSTWWFSHPITLLKGADHDPGLLSKRIANVEVSNQQTDSFRAEEESVQHEVGLTTYTEEVGVEEVEMENNADMLWRVANSLPGQGMSEVLSRSYIVDQFEWVESDTPLNWLRYLEFPKLLFDIPQIANKLEWFKFFRCRGIKVGVRLNTTAYHYGALAFSHVVGEGQGYDPDFGHDRAMNNRSPIQGLNNHAVLISAMTSETVEFEIPWDLPLQWINIHDLVADGRQSIIAAVEILVLDSLKMAATAVLPVGVTVFASFIDPEVQAMTAEPQSANKEMAKEAHKKTTTLSSIVDGVETVAGGIQKGISSALDIASKIAPFAALVLDKPTTVQVPTAVVPKGGANTYHGTGSSNAVKMSFHPDAAALVDPSLSTVGYNPSIKDFISTPGYHSRFFQNDEPSGSILATYRVSPSGFTASSVAGEYVPTYLTYMSNLFRYWRGSIVFHFRFFASKFTSTRLRISFFPGETSGTAPSAGPGGDIPSHVVDITGDTEISLSFPYIAETPWKPTAPGPGELASQLLASSIGTITVEVVNPIVSVQPGQSVSCFVWKNAGPDFQFNQFIGWNANGYQFKSATGVDPARTESAVHGFNDMVQPIVEGSTGVEIYGFADSDAFQDYVSLGKRYDRPDFDSIFPSMAISNNIRYRDSLNTESETGSLLVYLMAPYRWSRGSVRHRLFFNQPVSFVLVQYGTTSEYIEGGLQQTAIEIELPWYSKTVFGRTLAIAPDRYEYLVTPQAPVFDSVGQPQLTVLIHKMAFGDDFGFSGLYSPPVFKPIPDPPGPPPSTSV